LKPYDTKCDHMRLEQMFTAKQVMEKLNISKATLYRLMQRGELHSYKVGRSVRFKESDIVKYLEGQKR